MAFPPTMRGKSPRIGFGRTVSEVTCDVRKIGSSRARWRPKHAAPAVDERGAMDRQLDDHRAGDHPLAPHELEATVHSTATATRLPRPGPCRAPGHLGLHLRVHCAGRLPRGDRVAIGSQVINPDPSRISDRGDGCNGSRAPPPSMPIVRTTKTQMAQTRCEHQVKGHLNGAPRRTWVGVGALAWAAVLVDRVPARPGGHRSCTGASPEFRAFIDHSRSLSTAACRIRRPGPIKEAGAPALARR